MPTMPDNTATTFDEVVAGFADQPNCEMATQAGGTCRRAARWRIDLHGCEQVIMCGQHKNGWLRRMLAYRRQIPGHPRCAHCRTEFDTVDDAVRITAI